METLLLGTGAVGLVLAIVTFGLVRRLRAAGLDGGDLQRIQEFSVEYYAPLERLLGQEDVQFLRSQPGFVNGLDTRLMHDRRAIYRAYLGSLAKDFRAIHRAARWLVATSGAGHDEFAQILFRQYCTFWVGYGAAQVRLLVHPWVHAGSLSAAHLVESIAVVHRQLGMVAAAQAARI